MEGVPCSPPSALAHLPAWDENQDFPSAPPFPSLHPLSPSLPQSPWPLGGPGALCRSGWRLNLTLRPHPGHVGAPLAVVYGLCGLTCRLRFSRSDASHTPASGLPAVLTCLFRSPPGGRAHPEECAQHGVPGSWGSGGCGGRGACGPCLVVSEAAAPFSA